MEKEEEEEREMRKSVPSTSSSSASSTSRSTTCRNRADTANVGDNRSRSGHNERQRDRKSSFMFKLVGLCSDFRRILIVQADNVGSKQLQNIRRDLRGIGVVLMGKNTMMRKAIEMHARDPRLQQVAPLLRGNVGLIFTNEDPRVIRDVLDRNKVDAPARPGQISPVDVVLPVHNTGLDPAKTSFFQTLHIQTRIVRGTIELISPVCLLHSGDRVGSSEAALLQMLNIKPFAYRLTISTIYDNGVLCSPRCLDISNDDLLAHFRQGVNNIASFSLGIGYPTVASIPHSIANAWGNVVALSKDANFAIR